VQEKPDYNKLFDLSNQIGIITGGAGILGKAFAPALLANGATVVLADINQAAAENFISTLRPSEQDRIALFRSTFMRAQRRSNHS